jgi:hypothetical protein
LFQKRGYIQKSRFFFAFDFASMLYNPIFAARSKNGSSSTLMVPVFDSRLKTHDYQTIHRRGPIRILPVQKHLKGKN